MKIYLCGPINGRSDEECKGWRAVATQAFTACGHEVIDPMARDYRGRELEPGIAREIVENDKADIDACDVLFVYFDKPSVGTSMEVLYAWERGRFVFLLDQSGKPLSPWFIYHSHARTNLGLRAAIEATLLLTVDGLVKEV